MMFPANGNGMSLYVRDCITEPGGSSKDLARRVECCCSRERNSWVERNRNDFGMCSSRVSRLHQSDMIPPSAVSGVLSFANANANSSHYRTAVEREPLIDPQTAFAPM